MREMSDAEIRELAHKILARPEYADAQDPNRDALIRALRAFFDWLRHLETLRSSSPALYWTIFAGLLFAAALMIAQIIWTLWVALRAPDRESIHAAPAPHRDFAEEAETLAESGRYLEAAHALMLATFRALAEASVIELRPDRSNRWIRRALMGSTLAENAAAEICTLVERTEVRWFGDRADDPDTYLRWRAAFGRISSQLR